MLPKKRPTNCARGIAGAGRHSYRHHKPHAVCFQSRPLTQPVSYAASEPFAHAGYFTHHEPVTVHRVGRAQPVTIGGIAHIQPTVISAPNQERYRRQEVASGGC